MRKPILIGSFLAVVLLLTIAGTKISRLTETPTLPTTGGSLFVVVTGSTDKATRFIYDTNLITALSSIPNWPSPGSASATNYSTTNATKFGVFRQNVASVLQFFGIEQGSNIVIYNNGSNIVINSSASGTGGGSSYPGNPTQITTNGGSIAIIEGATLTNATLSYSIYTSGGNARGSNAVDLQFKRRDSTSVASGDYSVIGGGTNNTASGFLSVVPGGARNRALGERSYASGDGSIVSNTTSHASWSFGLDNFLFADGGVILGGNDNWINAAVFGVPVNSDLDTVQFASIVGSERSQIQSPLGLSFGPGFATGVQTIHGTSASFIHDSAYAGIYTADTSRITNSYIAAILAGSDTYIRNASNSVAIGPRNTNTAIRTFSFGSDLLNDTAGSVKLGHGFNATELFSNGTMRVYGDFTNGGNASLAGNLHVFGGLNVDGILNQNNTNLILGLTTDSSPVSGSYVMVADKDTATLTKVDIGNFGGGGVSDGDKGDISVTAAGVTWTIDQDSVNYSKLQNVANTQRILARNSAGSGDVEEVKISSILDWMGSTQGDILFRNATQWTNLTTGTAGQLLTAGGAGANPSWTTVGVLTDSDKGDITVTGGGSIWTIDPNTFTSNYLASSSVNSSKILDGTIQTIDLADSIVTSNKVVASAINSSLVLDGTIASVDVAPGILLTNIVVQNQTNNGVILFNAVGTVNAPWTFGDQTYHQDNINQNPGLIARLGSVHYQHRVQTNTARVLAAPLSQSGSNLVADASLRDVYTNALGVVGTTNIIVQNLQDGQTLWLGIYASNGVNAQLCTAAPEVQIPDVWYADATAIKINTNGFTWVGISRFGNWTNVQQVFTPSFSFVPGPGLNDDTNFATRVITRRLSSHLTNLVAVAASTVTNENSAALQIDSGTLTLSPGNLSNITATASVTNFLAMSWDYETRLASTNGAGTNILVNFAATNHVDLYTTNLLSQFTNVTGLATGSLKNKTIRITPSAPGQNLTMTWPVGNQHGIYRWMTNANSTFWTTLTNNKTYVVSMTAYGTNIHATLTLWE